MYLLLQNNNATFLRAMLSVLFSLNRFTFLRSSKFLNSTLYLPSDLLLADPYKNGFALISSKISTVGKSTWPVLESLCSYN